MIDGRTFSAPVPVYRSPRPFFPADVSPRYTRPVCCGSAIHAALGSDRTNGVHPVLPDPVPREHLHVRVPLRDPLLRKKARNNWFPSSARMINESEYSHASGGDRDERYSSGAG